MKKYDVFISYRRVGGKEKARPLKSELEKRGYKVFLDFDDLKDSVFDKRIMDAIDEAPIFLIILSEHSLDRCKNDEDWVRKEIEYADKKNKHFIPVNPDKEFKGFPDGTPESVRQCLGQHQFSSIDFEQLFIPSVNMMVKDRIEPIISSLKTVMNEKKGALIRIETDLDCRILCNKEELTVAKSGDITEIRLPKGKHKLTFEGLECKDDSYNLIYEVKDLEFEDYIEVSLHEKYKERVNKDNIYREEEKKRRQELERIEREKQERVRREKEEEEKRRKRRELIASKKKWIYAALAIILLVVAIVCLSNVSKQKRLVEDDILVPEHYVDTTSIVKASDNFINGHEYVDLGLPSGLKWATCNVGASKPEDDGNYYAWGETTTKKSKYTENNSKTYGKQMDDIKGNSQYDAARANWGGSWRLPTKSELEELLNNCTWTWTEQNGVNGYKVTGPNGNSIFLPAAGRRGGKHLFNAGYRGYYWSSTPYDNYDNYDAYYLIFYYGYDYVYNNDRYSGQTVRPVSE